MYYSQEDIEDLRIDMEEKVKNAYDNMFDLEDADQVQMLIEQLEELKDAIELYNEEYYI